MVECATKFVNDRAKNLPIVMTGSNSNRFDVPRLLLQCELMRCHFSWNIVLSLDVLELIRVSKLLEHVKAAMTDTAKSTSERSGKKVTCFSLSNVYSHLEKKEVENAHDSLGDTVATLQVLRCLREQLNKQDADLSIASYSKAWKHFQDMVRPKVQAELTRVKLRQGGVVSVNWKQVDENDPTTNFQNVPEFKGR